MNCSIDAASTLTQMMYYFCIGPVFKLFSNVIITTYPYRLCMTQRVTTKHCYLTSMYLFCLICRLVCLQSLKVICSLRWEILHAVLELNMELNLMWTLKQFFGLSPLCDGIWILALYPANFLIVKCKRCSVITFSYIHQMWFHRIYPSIIHFPLFPFFHIPISLYTFMLSF